MFQRLYSARSIVPVLLTAAWITAAAWGGDWPQWRGPGRDGVALNEKPIATTWPTSGPVKLWEVPAPSYKGGGLGSLVVSNGRVYGILSNLVYHPLTTRAFTAGELKNIGVIANGPLPPAVAEKVEAIRVKNEWKGLAWEDKNAEVKAWAKNNLSAEEHTQWGAAVCDRIMKGEGALPLDELSKLSELAGRTFKDQAELDAWIEKAGLSAPVAKAVNASAIKQTRSSSDIIMCLNAADGREIWKKEWEGNPLEWGVCATAALDGGRIFGMDSKGNAVCLSADDGKEIWRKPVGKQCNASFLIVEGLAIIPCPELIALNTATGDVVWKQPAVKTGDNSAVLFKAEDRTCAIVNTGSDVYAVDVKDGAILWKAKGGSYSTAAVAGDRMVILNNEKQGGLMCYRITPQKAELAWAADLRDRGASPIIQDGHVYAVGKGKGMCVQLSDGTVKWTANLGGGEIASPVMVGPLMLCPVGGGTLVLADASPEACTILAKAKIKPASCVSPAVSDGKLFLRLENAIACYDLTRAE